MLLTAGKLSASGYTFSWDDQGSLTGDVWLQWDLRVRPYGRKEEHSTGGRLCAKGAQLQALGMVCARMKQNTGLKRQHGSSGLRTMNSGWACPMKAQKSHYVMWWWHPWQIVRGRPQSHEHCQMGNSEENWIWASVELAPHGNWREREKSEMILGSSMSGCRKSDWWTQEGGKWGWA